MGISDEIRTWCDDVDYDSEEIRTTKDLRALADRIDAEMVELPKDADGVPIHVDDLVYLEDGRSAKVICIDIEPNRKHIVCLSCGWYLPSDLAHEFPDSFERIADELEEWSEDNRVNWTSDVSDRAAEFAHRIRKLAQKEDK